MPKDKAFSELSKKEKITRAEAARRKAQKKLTGLGKATNRSERAKAQKAKKAAERVIGRLGEAPERLDVTKPGKSSKSSKKKGGRKEDLFSGVKNLFEIGKGVAALPGKEKKNLKKIREGIE